MVEKGGWARSSIGDYTTREDVSQNKIIVSLTKYNIYKTLTYSFNSNIVYYAKLSEMKHLTVMLESLILELC